MRWYPNRVQWLIIWTAALASAHVWLSLRLSDLLGDGAGGWGFPAYLGRALYYSGGRQRAAVAVLLIGALLVWQASRWERPTWLRRRRIALLALAAVVMVAALYTADRNHASRSPLVFSVADVDAPAIDQKR